MKNYQEVVEERFNRNEDPDRSIYAPTHPVGRYIRYVLYGEINRFLRKHVETKGIMAKKKLLDVGCGDGGMLRFFVDNGFAPAHCTGIDFSEKRIERAQKLYPDIHFMHSDALVFRLDERFDLVTSFDLFSHFAEKEQIIKGLKNIHSHLSPDGIFLWYDIYSADHFKAPVNADSWGFSQEQMTTFAREAGFEVVECRKLFRLFFNRYQSVYQVRRLPAWLVRLLEKILPGSPGNLMMVLKKAA